MRAGMTHQSHDTGAVAALDCGTNSTRLLVADKAGAMLDRQMRVTRLGEGVDTTRKLSSEAIERTLAVLGDYREIMDRFGVTRGRLVATSAARDASNSEEFFGPARMITGVEPELLSGDQEGRLSFRGATADLPIAQGGELELIVDIGGGSTELVTGIPGGPDESIRALSLDIGCVRVTERFLYRDPPSGEDLAKARASISTEISRARETLGNVGTSSRIIGLAGTVSTLGSLSLGLASYERDKVHHTELALDDVNHWLGLLGAETTADRAKRPGMEPGRADVIVGGVLILSEVMAVFERATCLVSEADILDGMVASLL
jgi:exopolyphosphatase/guanosine-5'-triphosphate,3'-diphosphate pyrophosphatase